MSTTRLRCASLVSPTQASAGFDAWCVITRDSPLWPLDLIPMELAQAVPDNRLQCGVDLVEIERIEQAVRRYGERLLRRVWTERELAYCRGRAPELAARFAGKEAAMKALGTGLTGVAWAEIEILSDERGK